MGRSTTATPEKATAAMPATPSSSPNTPFRNMGKVFSTMIWFINTRKLMMIMRRKSLFHSFSCLDSIDIPSFQLISG
jgi:hypothetical protein